MNKEELECTQGVATKQLKLLLEIAISEGEVSAFSKRLSVDSKILSGLLQEDEISVMLQPFRGESGAKLPESDRSASSIKEGLRRNLAKFDLKQTILELVTIIARDLGFDMKNAWNFSNMYKMKFLLSAFAQRYYLLKDLLPTDKLRQLERRMEFLSKPQIDAICNKSCYLHYLFVVSRRLTPRDMTRLLTETEDLTISCLENSNRDVSSVESLKNQDLRLYVQIYSPELKTKFDLFARKEGLVKVCDFMTLLRTITQDNPNLQLKIATQLLKPGKKEISQSTPEAEYTNMFENINATKHIIQYILKFYLEVLQLNGEDIQQQSGQVLVPTNATGSKLAVIIATPLLSMEAVRNDSISNSVLSRLIAQMNFDYTLFLHILDYLITEGAFLWVDSSSELKRHKALFSILRSQQPPTDGPQKYNNVFNTAKGIGNLLDKGKPEIETDLKGPLAAFSSIYSINSGLISDVQGDNSLNFKLLSTINDLRLTLDTTKSKLERAVCDQILQVVSSQLTRLKLFQTNFDSKSSNLAVLKEYEDTMQHIFWRFCLKGTELLNLDGFREVCRTLGLEKELPDFSDKQFTLFFLVHMGGQGQIEFDKFKSIMEALIRKVVERDPNTEFKEVVDKILQKYKTVKMQSKIVHNVNTVSGLKLRDSDAFQPLKASSTKISVEVAPQVLGKKRPSFKMNNQVDHRKQPSLELTHLFSSRDKSASNFNVANKLKGKEMQTERNTANMQQESGMLSSRGSRNSIQIRHSRSGSRIITVNATDQGTHSSTTPKLASSGELPFLKKKDGLQ